jgi:transglutaminase-like putative cysteine protease
MRISIDHTTRYEYQTPVRHSTQCLRLVPQSNRRQRVLDWQLYTPGTPLEMRDGYGNVLHLLTLDDPVTEIVIRAMGTVETSPVIDEPADDVKLSPLVFLRPTPLTRAERTLIDFAEGFRRRAGTLSGLRELAQAVLERLPFRSGVTEVHSTAAEALEGGNGVCQDHAHVFIACCRYLGVPARYVSGYVYSPESSSDEAASHAWTEAWVVDRWRSFDVTNAQPAGEFHVRLAIGADYLEALPVRGVRRGGGVEHMSASAQVGAGQ